MTNLPENTVKFMGDQPAPHIEIGARYDGEKPVFFVRVPDRDPSWIPVTALLRCLSGSKSVCRAAVLASHW